MTRLLDSLVSYFGLDENERPGFRRYFCYHVLAGPGPTAGAGVAVILTLAVYSDTERCDSCQHFHTVESGGPEAALSAAAHRLAAYHEEAYVRRAASDPR